jgi:hypothetical protein
MKATNVHLEDVTRAARQGIALAFAASLLALAAMLVAGLPLAIGLAGSAALLALGATSGGFGLVARIALRGSHPRRRSTALGGAAVAPLRVPQPR